MPLVLKKGAYMLLENFHLLLSDHLDKPKRNTGQFKKQVGGNTGKG